MQARDAAEQGEFVEAHGGSEVEAARDRMDEGAPAPGAMNNDFFISRPNASDASSYHQHRPLPYAPRCTPRRRLTPTLEQGGQRCARANDHHGPLIHPSTRSGTSSVRLRAAIWCDISSVLISTTLTGSPCAVGWSQTEGLSVVGCGVRPLYPSDVQINSQDVLPRWRVREMSVQWRCRWRRLKRI